MVKAYTKNYLRTKDASHIKKFMSDTDMSQTGLAATLGVSPGGLSSWINKDDAPRWTLVAIEGLRRRMKGTEGFQGEKIASLEQEIEQLKDGQAAQRQEGQVYDPGLAITVFSDISDDVDKLIVQLMQLKIKLS